MVKETRKGVEGILPLRRKSYKKTKARAITAISNVKNDTSCMALSVSDFFGIALTSATMIYMES